jgi:Taurine catabolism dioxygenase TauD, TfdA family
MDPSDRIPTHRNYYSSLMGTTAGGGTFDVGGDWRGKLEAAGWAIVSGLPESADAEAVLETLGELREQYRGAIRHEVRARPGFEALQYSQSQNGITPHTEAPGLAAPPRYLALHCHRQARCGGGQTLLADGYAFIDSLGDQLGDEVRSRPIRFDLVASSGAGGEAAVPAPIFTPARNGTPAVLRYSYNVLRDNSLDAPTHDDPLALGEIDPFNAELCRRGVEFVRSEGFGALPADGELLVFDNWRMLHARDAYRDPERHLTRYWIS